MWCAHFVSIIMSMSIHTHQFFLLGQTSMIFFNDKNFDCQFTGAKLSKAKFWIVTWNYFLLVIQNFQLLDWWWFDLHHWSNDWKNIIIAQKHLVANFQLPNLERICCLARKKFGCHSKQFWSLLKKQFDHCPKHFSCPIDGGPIPTSVLMIQFFLSFPKKVQLLFEKISVIEQKCFSITTLIFWSLTKFFLLPLEKFFLVTEWFKPMTKRH